MEISEIFENYVKIEPKVMSIESLFNNEDRLSRTNYKPFYQRNYVWDDEKATYFIESILLGTEIPPLIYFRNSDGVEIIDGRQRYETILNFKDNDFKLRKNGLQKLENIGIANKYFKNIDEKLRELFWDTKLRIIEFSFHSKSLVNDEIEEIVKKEIFKRYNSGITPLKPTDIAKAAYIDDDLNSYFKRKLNSDAVLYGDVSGLLYFEKSNIEVLLKKIRQLLVLHYIPIKYFSVKKDSIIAKYFEFMFNASNETEIEQVFDGFITKINLLKKLRGHLKTDGTTYNRLIFECVYWALSILEVELKTAHTLSEVDLRNLASYISANKDSYKMERSSFSKELHHRFQITSEFFKNRFGIDFTAYLQNNPEFKEKTQELEPINSEMISFEELRINKPEPSSIAIDDICRQMEKQRFLIRPPYQRNEVINKKKSSAIIESILMGIKLPPIFVFKRKDDVSEVLDGQQRLLSILGFIGKPYLDENNVKRFSDKDGYSLNLKNGVLKNLSGKTFEALSKDEKEKIKNFDLSLIEINEKNNERFDPIDLFIRLNNKPYPIKEDTFEMWNSYISRDIIVTIKAIHRSNKDWFYFRKNNSRMEDENIYTSLIFLQYQKSKLGQHESQKLKDLDIYKIGDKINFRLKAKNDITKILEGSETKSDFIKACFDFEFDFLKKLKVILSDEQATIQSISNTLDDIFGKENNRRTQQSFYALWYFINDISLDNLEQNKYEARKGLSYLFRLMDDVISKTEFEKNLKEFKKQLSSSIGKIEDNISELLNSAPIKLSDIAEIHSGMSMNLLKKFNKLTSTTAIEYIKDYEVSNFIIKPLGSTPVAIDDRPEDVRNFLENPTKIILKKINFIDRRLDVGMISQKSIFGNNSIMLSIVRFGFDPKFITSILSSSLINYYVRLNASGLSGTSQISSHLIQNIPLPIVKLEEQLPLIRMYEYVSHLPEGSVYSGFFMRLIDALTYELYFKEEFNKLDLRFSKYLSSLPDITHVQNATEQLTNIYFELSNSHHAISALLYRLLTVELVVEIEGVV
ncbi:DUF262 domain-containing protein [Mucilaginibacter polytrichastri]|uniref:GmrSD restriction endonucleases N-terminal domain-containing protein n=1 Tax=Mucilaginibacter polytrichastri TaxID=1302689 RepID=A0A1Q5ZY29_9SPHI|nr:DUF262 domain-containing protein [Mucilaginibacter polytrichastri]OKS86666.1 hypothetical protein RG47T_2123 [Mucilaginibacter polytrichastri]SFS81832.1 Protein of unknown function DUF262 [Mucilaginibacter polytrichastri]